MSSKTDFPSIPLSDVFDDLASGSRGSLTVLTPNRRLARAVKSEFDRIQAKSATAWNSADILPISAFVERIYSEALYSSEAAALPVLLSPIQERVLWEDAINCSDSGRELLDVGEAARLASEAWQLAHAWHLIPRLDRHLLNEDARAFRQWSRQYEETARRRTDKARVGGLVLELLARPEIAKPRRLVCYGFDIVTRQHAALLTRLKEVGCEVVIAQAPRLPVTTRRKLQRLECDDVRDEMQRAAQWARANLETVPSARIGIVAPDLAARRSAIFRIFSAVMEPDVRQGLAQPDRELPFNISLGEPLVSYPLVNAALLLLDLSTGKVAFEQVSVLLRSPFISGGEVEMIQRAWLDIRLRKRAEEMVTLDRLLVLLERERNAIRCPDLLRILAALHGFSKTALGGLQKPSALARGIAEALRLIGFPGERRLDSPEYQVLKKWQEVLADFATLDSVISRTTCKHAVTRLRRMAAEVIFQPETADVPIQILGALESAGMTFDHLWVMGLSNEAWPPQARPNPFLPVELQREVPWSSAQATLELARTLTDHWLGAADDLVLSHPRHGQGSETQELSFSPLIESISAGALAPPLYPAYRDLIHEARKLERLDESDVPALRIAPDARVSAEVHGGTAVIKDHAACQFRSFALYRLRGERPERPPFALGPAERGTLIHHVLAEVWRKLKTKDALDAINEPDLEVLLRGAANDAIDRLRRDHPAAMSRHFSEIERRRLIRLAREWLSQDRKRADFSVVAVEEKRTIEIGGLALTARLDRVDELADGRRVIIDYKSRAPTAAAMLDERPEEPQLPLYLVAGESEAVAVAFAQVKPGDSRFVALARDDDLLPGAVAFPGPRLKVKHTSWNELVDGWRTNLVSIATSFSAGSARMNPRKYPHTCRNCEFRSLCRIDERVGGAFGQDEESE
ncbi:MAG TPA: PD-(D/E)XK nuclease family protein [Nitrosospira sp.]|nr:PD-(D/E)XK nuclease family protein [Nitrosospira sp.]